MNKTLANFFGVSVKEKSSVAAVVDAVVDSLTGDSTAETQKEKTAEGTDRQRPTVPAEGTEPTGAEAVTGEDTDAPVEAAGGAPLVGEETIEKADAAAEKEELSAGVIEGEGIETPADEATPRVEMASLPSAELSQIRMDAASWNANKGEFAVLQNWYKNATGASSKVGATVETDAADAKPAKKKSWESAPWNN